MPGEAAKKQKQPEWGNQQEERRRDERRQTEQQPQEERRRDDRRQGPRSTNTTMRTEEQSEHGQEPNKKQWQQGENAQSGTSQAQKGEGRTPQQSGSTERHEQGRRERPAQDFGESRDPAFGGGGGAGGKIDSSQRDMGQTGQNMQTGKTKAGEQHHVSQQQGPYGPGAKHRGPVASGKPLLDDWGKSDKH